MKSSSHYLSKGIPGCRFTKRKIHIRVGKCVWCNRAAPDFGRAHHRARETWQYRRSIRRLDRRLARKIMRQARGYQGISHLPCPKIERGERGEHAVSTGDPYSNKITDTVETSTHVEEAIPRKYLIVSWREHDALSACLSLRLGGTRQYQPVYSIPSQCISIVSGAEDSSYFGDHRLLLTSLPLCAVAV